MIHLKNRRMVCWFAVVAAMICSASATAQQFKSDAVDDRARLLGPLAQNCVKVPGRYATDKDRFTEFFTNYFFPAMTRNEPDDLVELGKMRDTLLKGFLWPSTDEQLQRDLTEIAFEKTWPIAVSKDYHPAVRYNAVLILGRLDKQYAIDATAGHRPPIPLEKATEKLVLIVNSAAAGKAVPPYLLVGALVGLERHAQYSEGLSRETVESINAAVAKLSAKEVPLPEVDTKVVEWIRLQAANVLAQLAHSQANAEQLAALDRLITGDTVPKISLDARCQAAALLGVMKFDGATVDGKATAEAMLNLALAVADDEAKEAKAFQEMNIQSGGGGLGRFASSGTGKGRMKMNAETQEMELDNRVLLTRLSDLKRGLTAAKPIAPADKQPVIDAVIAAIGPAVTAAESSDVVDLAKADKVVAMAKQIRDAVKPGSAPAPAAAAASDF